MNFLFPTRKKVLWTLVVIVILVAIFFLYKIHPSLDIIDARKLSGVVVVLFGRFPIDIFDWITSNRFMPKGEGFITFPSIQQVCFAIIFDIFFIYSMICIIFYFKKKD